MRAHTPTSALTAAEFPGHSNRRHGSRTPALFSQLYSSLDRSKILIGDSIVTNLSPGGIGIRGNRSVAPGMRRALVVDLPRMAEPLRYAPGRLSSPGFQGIELEWSCSASRWRKRSIRDSS